MRTTKPNADGASYTRNADGPSSFATDACAVAFNVDDQYGDDEEIFVIGGKSGNREFLQTVEYFDIETRTWTSVASMTQPRWGLGCTTTAGKVYAVGGKRRMETCTTTPPLFFPSARA